MLTVSAQSLPTNGTQDLPMETQDLPMETQDLPMENSRSTSEDSRLKHKYSPFNFAKFFSFRSAVL